MPLLELNNVSVSFGKEPVLQNVSFSLSRGETVAVIGPNGSGKTTLLKAIIGAVPFKGEIKWGERARIGYVSQKIDLERDFPLTIGEFLDLYPVSPSTKSFTKREVLSMVGLNETYLPKSVSELSSGQFQRVLIAFALISKPDILLFDEPTSGVDVAGEETMYEMLHRLQDQQHFALLLISHDLSIVYRYAKKVLCLKNVQLCFGTPQDVLTPTELEKLYGGNLKFYHHLHHEP